MNRGITFARALGALVLVGALVIGVPALLLTLVGNPFPADVPTIDEIRILLTQNGQGFTNFLISSLAVLIWVIWAQLFVALVAEVAATLRQTETRRLRIAPGMQGFAARLIAAITLATILAAGPLIAPAVGALTFDDTTTSTLASALTVNVQAPPSAEQKHLATVPQDGVATAAVADAATMVVEDHTELWDLADAVYGDGVSWKLIAQANAGTADASGTVITADTELVAPGTQLVLPGAINRESALRFGSLVAQRSASSESAAPSGALHRIASGDSMWTVAQGQVADRLGRPGSESEVASYWATVVASNQDVSSGNVDMIYPDEMLHIPGEFAPEVHQVSAPSLDAGRAERPAQVAADIGIAPLPTRESEPAETPPSEPEPEDRQSQRAPQPAAQLSPSASTPQPPAANPDTQLPVPTPVDTAADSSHSAPAVALVGLGTAMLSAGVVSAVRRRRDAQRRTRPAGTMSPAVSPEAAAFEAAIAYASHELKQSTQGLGWRAMPASTVAALRAAGPVEVHAAGSGQLVAVAASASDGDGARRRVDLANDVADVVSSDDVEATGSWAAPMAASLIIGTEDATGDAVLIDLAPATMIGMNGNAAAVRRFVRSAVLDLAVSERADDICVVAIDIATELGDLERVHCVAGYPEALEHITRTGHGAEDDPTPVVVLSATAPPSDEDDCVRHLLATGATILAPGIAGKSNISLVADQATITPSGTIATVAAPDDEDYRSVSELVEATSAGALEVVDESVRVEDVLGVAAIDECPIEPGPIEVKILGPVLVSGAAPFSSLKAVDVVAYLAFHRHGVDADQIKSWVWPPFDPPTDKAFANVMSRARTGLGADEGGEPYLSRAGSDKTYRLAAAVTTDFDRVRALGELADQSQDDASTLVLLKQALDLIRGVPFTGGAASSFAWADNHVRAQVEYTIDEMVHRCADLALELDDLATARWAALKGLELVPGCEQCFRRRFLIARAGNNRNELRRAMADLEAAAMVDLGEPEAVDNISGDLLDLYHELDRALVAGTS